MGRAKLATKRRVGVLEWWDLDGQRGGPGGWKELGRKLVGTVGRSQTEAPDPAAPRYAFLLDKALLICKRRGDSYDLKDFVNLHSFQVRDDSSGERDNKKVGF